MNTIILSAILGIVLMFSGAFIQNKSVPKYLAIAGMLLMIVANAIELCNAHAFFEFDTKDMIRTGNYSLTFIGITQLATLLFFLLSGRDIQKVGSHAAEYFALLFFIMCGVAITATYNTLLMLFLGIEIISIPLYVLTGSSKNNLNSNEAALKYFLMGTFSTGIMLMGIAMVYGGNASASFYINNIELGKGNLSILLGIGMVLMFVAMSFKVSAVPFHFWTPDVYDGAPTVFTSFMSTIVKVAGFFAFTRLFENTFGVLHSQWQNLVIFVIVATLLVGNITAVFQQSVKRMLAYSSIAQAGFMMFVLFSLNDRGREGLIIYTAAYSFATIGLFAIIARMRDFTIEGFNGLGKKEPVVAATATVFLLSLTGIPLTAGFAGKFYMLLSAVEGGKQLWVVITAVLFAAVSAYYYFRVIQSMYFRDAISQEDNLTDVTRWFRLLLIASAIIIVVIGVYPELVVGWIYH